MIILTGFRNNLIAKKVSGQHGLSLNQDKPQAEVLNQLILDVCLCTEKRTVNQKSNFPSSNLMKLYYVILALIDFYQSSTRLY